MKLNNVIIEINVHDEEFIILLMEGGVEFVLIIFTFGLGSFQTNAKSLRYVLKLVVSAHKEVLTLFLIKEP